MNDERCYYVNLAEIGSYLQLLISLREAVTPESE